MNQQPVRLRWYCPNCDAEHNLTEPLDEGIEDARNMLAAGIKFVAIYHEAYAIECDLDRAVEATPFALYHAPINRPPGRMTRFVEWLGLRRKSL